MSDRRLSVAARGMLDVSAGHSSDSSSLDSEESGDEFEPNPRWNENAEDDDERVVEGRRTNIDYLFESDEEETTQSRPPVSSLVPEYCRMFLLMISSVFIRCA